MSVRLEWTTTACAGASIAYTGDELADGNTVNHPGCDRALLIGGLVIEGTRESIRALLAQALAANERDPVDLEALARECGYYEDPDDADDADDDAGTDGLIDYKNALEDLVGRLTA